MRTTLTLDDDVAALLKRVQGARKSSLKAVVNEALREGLLRLEHDERKRTRFRTTTVHLGACRAGSLDNVAEVLATTEGEAWQ